MRVFRDQIYALSPERALSNTVSAGEVFSCVTLDASGNQIAEGRNHADLDPARVFPVNGALGLAEVRVGDAVGISIRSITASPWGHTWTRPGLGVNAPPESHVRRLSSQHPIIDWGSGAPISVPPQLHIGTIGLLPDTERLPRTLGRYGGNLDSVLARAGSTVWITAQVPGGGLFLGDVHAAMGDAEVCGTGIEVAAEVELSVSVQTDWAPRFATIDSDEKYSIIVTGDTFDDALSRGVGECTRLLAAHAGMSTADAYLAVGLLLEVRVCQVVNPRRSLALSLLGGADAALGPPSAAR
ncbi:acetamidase/formamidase family protein [Cryobacterium sp. TMS1-13-1]|uniref:acetamidase/formamidase family protein n=1 Tax=Cryobacterium sp. TMS1-13-1 TaxID=1259220 RepID=UPI0010695E97|nr:acetamidase/formamidase family protein [Cryobacterium sp. TMS1-13-1]TFD21352.1 hypothetical protein E3T31_11030 [Cryobacterium sp. TMS1-13-1]